MRTRGRVAGIASAVAVVLSLIFVGLEVRESARQTELNTQSLQLGAYQDLILQIAAINLVAIEYPEVSLAIQGSLEGLSPAEREQANNAMFMMARHGDMAFYQYELGMLTEERLESALGLLNVSLCRPGFREWWSNVSHLFVASYREFVSAKISANENCE